MASHVSSTSTFRKSIRRPWSGGRQGVEARRADIVRLGRPAAVAQLVEHLLRRRRWRQRQPRGHVAHAEALARDAAHVSSAPSASRPSSRTTFRCSTRPTAARSRACWSCRRPLIARVSVCFSTSSGAYLETRSSRCSVESKVLPRVDAEHGAARVVEVVEPGSASDTFLNRVCPAWRPRSTITRGASSAQIRRSCAATPASRRASGGTAARGGRRRSLASALRQAAPRLRRGTSR